MDQMDPLRRSLGRGVFNRRNFLSGSAAGALALSTPAILRSSPARAEDKVVNVSGYGGLISEYMTKLFGIPFEKKTGIKVNFGSNASLALAKLQATSGSPAQWDLISLTGSEYYVAIDQKLIVPYDYNIIDATHVPPEYKKPYGIKFSLFLFVMAWDKRKISDDKAPQSWAEFWDTDRFKGKRSLYANISDGCTLENALLADGVPLDKLYPLDVPRALRSLERLGRDNIIWYNTNQEPIQQLTSGAVTLANAFDGRVALANHDGAQLGFTPNYGGVSGNQYCVSAASARKTEAFQFLNFMLTEAKADADYMALTDYAVPNTAALDLVPQSIRDILPTSAVLKDKVFIKDDHWWATNLAQATTTFKAWQLAG